MFSDRNLYRPAETMHLKGIMRTLLDNKLSVTPVEEVQLTIRDGRQREVAVRQVKPSDAGTFDLDFTFPEGETGDVFHYRQIAVERRCGGRFR